MSNCTSHQKRAQAECWNMLLNVLFTPPTLSTFNLIQSIRRSWISLNNTWAMATEGWEIGHATGQTSVPPLLHPVTSRKLPSQSRPPFALRPTEQELNRECTWRIHKEETAGDFKSWYSNILRSQMKLSIFWIMYVGTARFVLDFGFRSRSQKLTAWRA